jgi:tRNA A-37 threonylcarbamoyl transferase component Bud32
MLVEGYTTLNVNDVQWLLKDDAHPVVKEHVITHLSSETFFKHSVSIKRGKHKSIWLFTPPADQEDESFLIKRYENKHLLNRLKTLFMPSKALQELKAALGIDQRGIPTPLPVAVGERITGKMVKESFVVLSQLKACQALNTYFLIGYPEEKSLHNLFERRKIIKALGEVARKAHQGGVLQSDFSLNNFLLTKEAHGGITIYLSDFEKITLKDTLSFDQKVTCLAKLNRIGREISLADRWRFLQSYAGYQMNHDHVASLARTVQKRTVELLKQDYSRGRITSVYTDALYEKYEQENITGYFKKGYIIKDILGIIHKFDLLAKSLPSSEIKQREEITVELNFDGTQRPLKAVRYIPHAQTISARTFWTTICTLAIAGLPLDIPHALMEMRVKSNQEGFLFMPQRKNAVDLSTFLKTSREKKEILLLLDLLVMLMKKLHHFGIFSDRMTARNFTVLATTGKKPSLCLSTIETFTMKNQVTENEKKRDVMLLSALIKKHCPTITYDLTHRYFKTPYNS